MAQKTLVTSASKATPPNKRKEPGGYAYPVSPEYALAQYVATMIPIGISLLAALLRAFEAFKKGRRAAR